MKNSYWFKPGVMIKRWIVLGVFGAMLTGLGLLFLFHRLDMRLMQMILALLTIISGCMFIAFSYNNLVKTFQSLANKYGFKLPLYLRGKRKLIFGQRILIRGPKIVAIGGGTGLSTMLRGLKLYSSNITAVVTVADDGGGSGILREDLGMLPPGDIRNCILALADTEPIMEKLLQYRFSDGMLKGQSFGNLFLAAMNGITNSFEEAVRNMSDVLAVTGRVLPVTNEDIKLCAELEDGHIICGESNIGKHNSTHPGRIKRVYLEPNKVKPLPDVLEAIDEADAIILGPGSLYTSVIPNLLVDGVCDAIRSSKAIKIYVCNVMTQPGETDGYTAADHIDAIERHSYKGMIDYCIVNNEKIPDTLLQKYMEDGAETVRINYNTLSKLNISIIEDSFITIKNGLIRHDANKLASVIMDLIAESILIKDKKRIMDYYYVKDRLKKAGKVEL